MLRGVKPTGGHTERGFTLLELVIVLAVIGFASILAIAALDRAAASASERSWSDRTLHELRRLRVQAVTSGDVVHAVLDRERSTLEWTGTEQGQTVRLTLPSGFSFAWADAGDDRPAQLQLRFYPDGSALSREFRLAMPSGVTQAFAIQGVSGRIWRGDEGEGRGG